MADSGVNKKAKYWVVAGGVFNCLLAFPLSFPSLYEKYIGFLNYLNSSLGLNGKKWLPPVDGANMLFINTSGLALFLVGMLLLYSSRDISNRIGIPLFNAIIRFIWACIAIYYMAVYELFELLYFLIFADLLFSIVFCFYFFKIKANIESNQGFHRRPG